MEAYRYSTKSHSIHIYRYLIMKLWRNMMQHVSYSKCCFIAVLTYQLRFTCRIAPCVSFWPADGSNGNNLTNAPTRAKTWQQIPVTGFNSNYSQTLTKTVNKTRNIHAIVVSLTGYINLCHYDNFSSRLLETASDGERKSGMCWFSGRYKLDMKYFKTKLSVTDYSGATNW